MSLSSMEIDLLLCISGNLCCRVHLYVTRANGCGYRDMTRGIRSLPHQICHVRHIHHVNDV
jgi:hypothetical protein